MKYIERWWVCRGVQWRVGGGAVLRKELREILRREKGKSKIRKRAELASGRGGCGTGEWTGAGAGCGVDRWRG